MKITFYTDGASRGNPGPGGWGVYTEIITKENEEKTFTLSGGKPYTTNNRMELTATIQALAFLDKVVLNKYFVDPEKYENILLVTIKTDSQYVKNGITLWVKNWEKNNWRGSNKKEVINKDLWQELLKLKNSINEKLSDKKLPEINFEYVAGHVGIKGNEMADNLATTEADKFKK